MEVSNVSIVIPIYNEEQILEESIVNLKRELQKHNIVDYEIILCENGSSDKTVDIGEKLQQDDSRIKMLNFEEPNYGKALRGGINESKAEYVVCYEIDFWSVDFLQESLELLKNYDVVVGSKLAKGSVDKRPLTRRIISKLFNSILHILLGFDGTDTHGMKTLRRSKIIPIVEKCVTDKDIFATELMVRSEREKLSVVEVPLEIEELRPGRVNCLKRVPSALRNMCMLYRAIKCNR